MYKTICLKITGNVTTIPTLFSCLGLQFKRLINILFQLEGEGAEADRVLAKSNYWRREKEVRICQALGGVSCIILLNSPCNPGKQVLP